MSESRESMWAAALRHFLDWLVCPHCGASNRPHAHVIELEDEHAHCNVCAHGWIVHQGEV